MIATPPIVGRLAPSPTGAQHLGNARTYLIAWLAARAATGTIILRIEDIDSPRIKPGADQQAIEDLRWLGLNWDEGPDLGGPRGPYVQTQRIDHYQQALQTLRRSDRIYPCTCSRTDVAQAASAPHVGQEGPIYAGTCAGWRDGDPVPASNAYCWRFRSSHLSMSYTDLVAGQQQCVPSEQLGDWVIARRTGEPSYQLAAALDDAMMRITQVIRGDDLLPSTFRQLDLLSALEHPAPQHYAHVPLVVGTDRRRLAKRHGDTRLATYRQQGITAAAIIGWAAWSAGLIDRIEPVAAKELVDHFDWPKIQRSQTIVDPAIESQLAMLSAHLPPFD
jgi:glutamyl-tRNA synthetase